jgi:DAK2 domain fusion protein YloV
MLTVIKDSAAEATAALAEGVALEPALERVAAAAFESVKNTPELLAVLKENGVVDAGGYGLALLVEGFVAAALGKKITVVDVSSASADLEHITPVDDWSDTEYLYCTEFLLFGEAIDRDSLHDYVAGAGGSELVVGDAGAYKVHVHTNDPGAVLNHVTAFGEVAEVHVNNMRRQQTQRDASLRAESVQAAPTKPVGVVAVAAGSGFAEILASLGVDEIVTGGQTMNPSTQELVDAIERVNAEKVIVLPNNKNILLAAGAAASVSSKPVGVVPTRSIPQAFSALLAFDGSAELEALVGDMTDAAATVRTGEVTTAVKAAKGKPGDIAPGQVIGIVDDEDIEAIGDTVADVALATVAAMIDDDTETLTLFAGEDLDDTGLAAIAETLHARFPQLVVETYRGEQPLYPLVMSAE